VKIIIASLTLLLSACTIATTPNGSYFTLGVGKIEQCKSNEEIEGKVTKQNCDVLESKGLSAEFAGIMSIMFRWWPF